jgi:ATP-binding protein involved in chromosome partitioning
MPLSKQDVAASLAAVRTPDGASLSSSGRMSDILVTDGKVYFSITVDASAVPQWEAVRKEAEAQVRALPGVASVLVALTAERAAAGPGPQATAPAGAARKPGAVPTPSAVPGVGSIIAVASGKGGVGKSTTAANLALGLLDLGLSVGLLDADIYGPSVPKLLGIREKPEMLGGNRLKPISRFGLSVMSIGFLVDEEAPMIWRGPMVISAITQMLREVAWGTLDVMVVDMPPGTGDAQLTMAQQVPLAGAVIVSTPQDLALIDARRAVAMFRRVEVPILGVVENMSTFHCPQCGFHSDIFGHGGGRREAERLGVPFLGEIPLEIAIRETSDAGRPVMASAPDGPHARAYREVAERVRAGLSVGRRAAPKITIEPA